MVNWDDIRIFLAVARRGSIRGAAMALKVNHSTVSRRITAFEEGLNVRLFERMPSGYLVTSAGEDLLETALRMEKEVNHADRRIFGGDNRMSGRLRVTMPAALGTTILIKEFVEFCELYPDINLDLIHSYELADLNKREADVAIRISNDPPEYLVGRRILAMGKAVYISKNLWERICDNADPVAPCWLGWKHTTPQEEYIKSSIFSKAPIHHVIRDPDAMHAAVRAGMGVANMVCLIGDADPALMRVPPGKTTPHRDVWVLTHIDLRHTLRVKTFMDFTANALLKHRKLLEGHLTQA